MPRGAPRRSRSLRFNRPQEPPAQSAVSAAAPANRPAELPPLRLHRYLAGRVRKRTAGSSTRLPPRQSPPQKKQVGKVTPRLKTCPRQRCQTERSLPRERRSRADSSRLRSLRGVAIAPGLLGTAAVKAPKETSAPRSDTRPKRSL